MCKVRYAILNALALAIPVVPGCGVGAVVDPALIAAADELQSTESAETVRDIGDGLAARRSRIPELFPEVNTLIAAGSSGAAAVIGDFSGQPTIDSDEALSVYAYVLEQIGDAGVAPDLIAFLRANATGQVPSALSSVTHAVRALSGMSTNASAAYLISEIEETIVTVSGAPLKARPVHQFITTKQSCSREFYLLDANGTRIRDVSGKEVRIGGTVFNPTVNDGFAASGPATRLAANVVSSGGTPFDYVDPRSRVTFQGQPTRRINCAGFVFRHFVNNKQWIADPQLSFVALNDAGLLQLVEESDVQPGDFAFFTQTQGIFAHVAEVETVDSGITVINADGPTGMFRAPVTAAWFSKYVLGVTYYRWRNGAPRFEPVTERSQENSCFGTDLDGDGWPELVNCTSADNCIDPVIGGIQPNPGFRAWRITNYGAEGGYITVLSAEADLAPPLLSSYPGGGIDPEVRATLASITDPFPTREEVVDSLCDRVSGFYRHPLATFVLSASFDGQDVGIDVEFEQRCPD